MAQATTTIASVLWLIVVLGLLVSRTPLAGVVRSAAQRE